MKQFLEKITRTAPARVLWWLLLAAALFGAVVSGGYIYLAAGAGCYDPDVPSFYESEACWSTARIMAEEVLNTYLEAGEQAAEKEYGADQSNSRFRISCVGLDGSTSVLWDTVADREAYHICRIGFQMQASGTAILGYALTGVTRLYGSAQDDVLPISPDPALNTFDAVEPGETGTEVPPDTRLGAFIAAAGEMDEFTSVQYSGVLEFALADPLTPGTDRYIFTSWGDQELWQQCSYFISLQSLSGMFPVWLALCTAAGVLAAVMLLAGAGRRPGRTEPVLCWVDRVPMELSLCVVLGVDLVLLAGVLRTVVDWILYGMEWLGVTSYSQRAFAVVMAAALVVTLCGLLAFAWLMAFARAAKTGHAFRGFWSVRLLIWLAGAARQVPAVPATALGVATFGLYNGWIGVVRHYNWVSPFQYLLLVFLWAVALAGSIYLAVSMRALQKQAARIAAGDYTSPADTRYMLPPLRRHAETLENIGAGMNAAVEQRMKSERLKTELITNVSHDLKTPLTSIINYTDLLQQEPLSGRAAEYAAALGRQGERLRKLTEDLIEASKASSGVMPCQKTPLNLCELCEQAIGEYGEKLDAAGLTPLLDLAGQGAWANVDGRLTWRVLDNLLNNACKYAMPGTRLYLSCQAQAGRSVILLKNISREPLNISAQELTERFVRGDRARAGEGSGLGLSIAQSLTELQGGRFTLSIDGDLFKAALDFPQLAPPAPAAPEADAVPE